MNGGKTRAVGVEGEYGAMTRGSSVIRGPIKNVSRQQQIGLGISSVAVGVETERIMGWGREAMQVSETRAIRTDGEDSAGAETSTTARRSVKYIVRQHQSGRRICSVVATREIVGRGAPCAIGLEGEHRTVPRATAVG